jgi:hypothetical protein
MLSLPINEKELNIIIEKLKTSETNELHQKLWSYKMNYLSKQKKEEK